MKANGIKIRIIPVIPEKFLGFDFPEKTNCIIIWKGGLAVVVDPGGEAEKIARFLRRNKLEVGAYWLTHAHPDHVGGLSALLDEFPAPVRYHRADSLWISSTLPIASIRKSEWFRPFCSIRRIACGGISAKVILTPGHTRGGVCYWFDQLGVLLTGDTIVRGGVGETGWLFPGSNSDERNASIQKIYSKVPQETKILPGHGSATTVGRESC